MSRSSSNTNLDSLGTSIYASSKLDTQILIFSITTRDIFVKFKLDKRDGTQLFSFVLALLVNSTQWIGLSVRNYENLLHDFQTIFTSKVDLEMAFSGPPDSKFFQGGRGAPGSSPCGLSASAFSITTFTAL